MQGFWKLTTVLIGLTGFTITGVVLLIKGDDLVDVVLKALAVFVVVYVVQNFLGGILFSVSETSAKAGNSQPGKSRTGEGG